jgi:hypothetical protein
MNALHRFLDPSLRIIGRMMLRALLQGGSLACVLDVKHWELLVLKEDCALSLKTEN